jgi:hypothetical protein
MAVAILQHKSGVQATAGSIAVTFTSNVTAGNTIIVLAGGQTSSETLSVTDDSSNTYSNTSVFDQTGHRLEVFWVTNPTLTINPPTITLHATASIFMDLNIREYSGLAASPADGSAGTTTITAINPEITDDLTTTGTSDLLVAVFMDGGAASNSGGSGWTNVDTITASTNFVFEDQLNKAAAAYHGACIPSGTNVNWNGMIAAFKASTADTTFNAPIFRSRMREW